MHSILAVTLEVHPQIALKAAVTQHDQTQTDRTPAEGCAVMVKGESFYMTHSRRCLVKTVMLVRYTGRPAQERRGQLPKGSLLRARF